MKEFSETLPVSMSLSSVKGILLWLNTGSQVLRTLDMGYDDCLGTTAGQADALASHSLDLTSLRCVPPIQIK
jgi:hypothetical protein